MANRHSHKKLRAEILARMKDDGESYQAARARILETSRATPTRVDLVAFRFFGIPMTLATVEGGLGGLDRPVTVLRAWTRLGGGAPLPFTAWLAPKGVN